MSPNQVWSEGAAKQNVGPLIFLYSCETVLNLVAFNEIFIEMMYPVLESQTPNQGPDRR